MRLKATISSRVTTPSAFAILAASTITAIENAAWRCSPVGGAAAARILSTAWPATAPTSAPNGPPSANPAAPPTTLPQMLIA